MEMFDLPVEKLAEVVPENRIYLNEPLRNHSTFKIGGPADYLVYVDNADELRDLVLMLEEVKTPYILIGNGSNLLFADEGFRGVVIKLSGDFLLLSFTENENTGEGIITAGSGVLLSKLSIYALKRGYTGLEFAQGIPGSVGGGVYMNAGAYGHEIKDYLISVRVLTKTGKIFTYPVEQLDLAYRHSRFLSGDEIVLEAKFRLTVFPRIPIRTQMEIYRKERMTKQPLDYPSAGSTFKRPEGYYAGKLIEDAGLKGYSVGGAAVSEKHAGFVINKDNATSEDVKTLIKHIQKTVFERTGVSLVPEIQIVSEKG